MPPLPPSPRQDLITRMCPDKRSAREEVVGQLRDREGGVKFSHQPTHNKFHILHLQFRRIFQKISLGVKITINQSRRISEVSSLGGGKLRKPCVRGGGCGQVHGKVYLWLEPKASSSGKLLAKPVACHPSPGHPPPQLCPQPGLWIRIHF